MFPILNIGPLAIPVPQISILFSIWFGLSLTENFAQKIGLKSEDIYNLVVIALFTGIIGARLGYIFENFSAFIHTPLDVFSLNQGMLDPFTGYSFGLLALIILMKIKNIYLWSGLDALVPLLGMFSVGLSISNIASGRFYGSVTNLPWGINLWGMTRHPTQFYELILAMIILIICPKIFKTNSQPGIVFLNFIALTSASGLFLEGLRGNSQTIFLGIRALQVIYWVILLFVFCILEIRIRKLNKERTDG